MDIKLHSVEKGFGDPLVLLHGNGESHDYFVHQIEYFSNHYRVIAVDTRGHGRSPRGSAPFTIVQFADDLFSFLNDSAIKKVNLLGFSDGGNIALTFALKYPQMIDKLILNGANLNPSGVKRSVQIPIEIGYRIAKMFAKKDPKAIKNAETLALMVNEPNIAPERLGEIKSPTLVVVGTNDMIKESHSRLICNSLPNAQIAIINGNHFIANKNPQEFNRVVEKFLEGAAI